MPWGWVQKSPVPSAEVKLIFHMKQRKVLLHLLSSWSRTWLTVDYVDDWRSSFFEILFINEIMFLRTSLSKCHLNKTRCKTRFIMWDTRIVFCNRMVGRHSQSCGWMLLNLLLMLNVVVFGMVMSHYMAVLLYWCPKLPKLSSLYGVHMG